MTEPRPRSHRRIGVLSPRWLAAGGAVVLAALLGTALLLQNGGSACAAPPSTASHSGKATFYDLNGGESNCSYPSAPADDLFVALGPDQYSKGAACGTYLDVTGPKGKVRVKVTDSCPECDTGHLDLSRTAFKKIGAEVDGIIPITYKTVTGPSVPGPLTVRVKEGSSRDWLSVLIDNHGTQLSSVKVAGHTATHETYNYWTVDGGAGPGPFTVKITDVYGHTASVSGIKLSPGVTQKTTAHLATGGSTGTAVKTKAPAAKKSPATPKPSHTSASPVASSAAPEAAAPSAPVESTTVPPETAVDLAAGAAAPCH